MDSTQQSPGSGVCKKTIMTMVATLMVATLLVMAVKGYQFVSSEGALYVILPYDYPAAAPTF